MVLYDINNKKGELIMEQIKKMAKELDIHIHPMENGNYKIYMPYCVGAIPEICIFNNSNELYFFLLGFKKHQRYSMRKIKC